MTRDVGKGTLIGDVKSVPERLDGNLIGKRDCFAIEVDLPIERRWRVGPATEWAGLIGFGFHLLLSSDMSRAAPRAALRLCLRV